MSATPPVAARAIVLQMQPLALDRVPAGGHTMWLLTVTVMPDRGAPFRSRIAALLPDDASWRVHVGAHVPVRIGADTTGVELDVEQLQRVLDAARQHPAQHPAGSRFPRRTP